jgi:hypothetical protein
MNFPWPTVSRFDAVASDGEIEYDVIPRRSASWSEMRLEAGNDGQDRKDSNASWATNWEGD